jgi:hypothetical protein
MSEIIFQDSIEINDDDKAFFDVVMQNDNGRRIFTYLLQEFAQNSKTKTTELSTFAFEILTYLCMQLLNKLELNTGGDYICGKMLCSASSLIYTKSIDKEEFFLQVYFFLNDYTKSLIIELTYCRNQYLFIMLIIIEINICSLCLAKPLLLGRIFLGYCCE